MWVRDAWRAGEDAALAMIFLAVAVRLSNRWWLLVAAGWGFVSYRQLRLMRHARSLAEDRLV